jgi:hypothetical protein
VKTARHASSCSRKFDNGIMEEDKGKCRFSSRETGGSKPKKKARKHTNGRRVIVKKKWIQHS